MSFYVLLLISTVLTIVLIRKAYKKFYRDEKLLQDIPYPPGVFLLGNLPLLMRADTLFKKIRRYSKKYYPIYRFSTPYVNIVHLLDPNDIELVLSSTKHLTKSKIYTFLHNWLGTGLLTSSGVKWHKRRKILTPAFHFNILQQFLVIFNDETSRLVEKLHDKCDSTINVVPLVTNFTLQTIAETAMGFSSVIDETGQKKYKAAIHEIVQIVFKRLAKPWLCFDPIFYFSKLAREESRVIKILHDFSGNIIKEREKEMTVETYSKKKRLAMLDLLLSAKNQGADIDNEGIREEVDTFMFEGHDTTSMAISYLLLVLANLQDIQAQVLEEILSVVGPTKVPTYEDLQELRYTERITGDEFRTRTGHTIPAETVIHVHIFDVHRNDKLYPDPLKFDPDRFLPENVSARHPFAYIPFSAGPRNCIGQRFALLELKAALCGILRNFRLEKVDDMYEVEFKADLVLRPIKDVKVKILARV